MKKILYLMRHGQTLFNIRRKIQGWCDSPLTYEGKKQAEVAGQYFRNNDVKFDHAYCSTSERSIDTLEIVINNKIPYKPLKGLKEMYYGTFEGESEDLSPKEPVQYTHFFTDYGGESTLQVTKRMIDTLTNIMKKDDHKIVLAVSHSGACYNFLKAWQNPDEELKKGFPNCCIFKYEYENQKFKLLEIIRHKF